MSIPDINARVAVLEANQQHMVESMDEMKDLMGENNKELVAIRDMMSKTKGAWWMFAVLIGASGGVGALIHKLFP